MVERLSERVFGEEAFSLSRPVFRADLDVKTHCSENARTAHERGLELSLGLLETSSSTTCKIQRNFSNGPASLSPRGSLGLVSGHRLGQIDSVPQVARDTHECVRPIVGLPKKQNKKASQPLFEIQRNFLNGPASLEEVPGLTRSRARGTIRKLLERVLRSRETGTIAF